MEVRGRSGFDAGHGADDLPLRRRDRGDRLVGSCTAVCRSDLGWSKSTRPENLLSSAAAARSEHGDTRIHEAILTRRFSLRFLLLLTAVCAVATKVTWAELERRAILHAIDATGGNLSEVVQLLGIGRTTLYRKLKSLGLTESLEVGYRLSPRGEAVRATMRG